MKTAVSLGLTRPSKELKRAAPVFCPAGNCTWPDFETLGICHKCSDLTDKVKTVERPERRVAYGLPSTTFSLPNGVTIQNTDGTFVFSEGYKPELSYWMTAFSTGQPRKTATMEGLKTLLWSTSIIAIDTEKLHTASRETPLRWPDIPLKASECGLYYCVKTVKASVDDNIVQERQVEATRFSMTRDSWKPMDWETGEPIDADSEEIKDYLSEIPPGVWVDGQLPDDLQFDLHTHFIDRSDVSFQDPTESEAVSYSISHISVLSISEYFMDTWELDFRGEVKGSRNLTRMFNGLAYLQSYTVDSLVYHPDMITMMWTNETGFKMEETFEALAISLTNEMRSYGMVMGADVPDDPDRAVAGVMQVPMPIYHASWGWIAFHSVVLLGTLLFCTGTIAWPTFDRQTVLPI